LATVIRTITHHIIGACGIGAALQDWLGFFCFIYRFRLPNYRRNPADILPQLAAPASAC